MTEMAIANHTRISTTLTISVAPQFTCSTVIVRNALGIELDSFCQLGTLAHPTLMLRPMATGPPPQKLGM